MISRTGLRNLPRLTSSFSSSATDSTSSPARKEGESTVYRASRQLARPATVKWSEQLSNSVSLIGTVEYPFKQYTLKDDRIGAYTFFLVKPFPNSPRYLRVTLCMWDLLAERALAHLKANDYIYVSGRLGAYSKSTFEGTKRVYYKVTAKELNYVQVPNESYQVVVNSESDAGESSEQKSTNRLHLWQCFFANPDEWYDNRKTKNNSTHPDFKHKSSGEALWLSTFDPPWLKQQVELLDSRPAGRPSDDVSFGSFASEWVTDYPLTTSDSSEINSSNEISYNK